MDVYFEEARSVEVVNARLACANPRSQKIMAALVKHLPAFIKEKEPTPEEWLKAIRFLTKTGQICNNQRREWILLSDTPGVSGPVDAINHRRPGRATENPVLGLKDLIADFGCESEVWRCRFDICLKRCDG